jgi:phage host-nuclease inhibitor protein Gam
MPPQPLESRVESLERRVTTLEQLPARVDDLTSQIVQLRAEMRDGFSAVSLRITEQGTALREEMGAHVSTLRQEMAEQGKSLRQEMAEQGKSLRQEIADLATHMRVLHEDVIGRFIQLQDAWPQPPRRRPRKK